MRVLVTHARLATLGESPELIEDGALLIAGPRIARIGPSAALQTAHPDEEVWDAQGQLVLPGAICAHTHFYGAFARGWAAPGEPAAAFPQILERLWWRLDRALRAEDVRYSALVCLADAIRHGTTTLFDHHASPNAIEGSLDVIATAVREAGLRACLCYEVSDRDGPARTRAGIAENLRFARAIGAAPEPAEQPPLAASFGLHASLTLSEETLADCVSAGGGGGFHLHVAESEEEQAQALERYRCRVVERLQRAGVLGPRTIAAHAVHVDAREIALLAESGTWVTHQPRSNLNNGVGVAPVEALLAAGVRVGLGNDGFSNDMLEEMRAAALVHKGWQRDPRAMPAVEVLRMAYTHNAQLARLFWPDAPLGELRPGASADLAFYDYHPTTPLTAANLAYHLMFGVSAAQCTATVCAGRVLMRDRQLLTLDEERITRRSRELAAALWRRA